MMKQIASILFVAFTLPCVVFAYTSPGRPTGMVNDFARVISTQDVQNIEQKLQGIKQSTGFELTVVTIPTLGDETIESYADRLFQEWGIGDKQRDTGILLLIAIQDREVRIETGYGSEGAVTDIQSGAIIREVITPAFQQAQYAQGITGAVDAIAAIISGSPEAAQYSQAPTRSGFKINYEFLFFVVVIGLNLFARFLGKTRSWWLGGVIGAVLGGVIAFFVGLLPFGLAAIIILMLLGLLFDFIVSRRPPGSHGGGFWPMFFGGHHGGSGFGGGGFGGFGGGSSGGGGASGRW